jgi:hypothetical protein
MPDDKTKRGQPDRSKVAVEQDYEINYLADKHGLSSAEERDLLARFGTDREALETAIRELKQGR